jgi:hypothetical protein
MGDETREGAASTGHRRWLLAGGVTLFLAACVVAFGYFGVHTLFVDDVVSEEGPVFASGAVAAETGEPTSTTTAPDTGPGSEQDAPTATVEAEAEAAAPVVVTEAVGMFEGVGRYSGAGTAVVLSDGAQRFVRFEDDFSTTNGPDLFVFLGTGSGRYDDPVEYIELGVLRGNIGSQNYEVPAVHPGTGEPIDLSVFDHVAVWCRRFDATFAIARVA